MSLLVALALLLGGQDRATVVEAGETLTLTEDLVLTAGDTLEVRGSAERRCAVAGNGRRIRSTGEWKGYVRILHADVRDLGGLDLAASRDADVTIEGCAFATSGAIRLRLDGESTARFARNVVAEDSLVPVDKAREKSFPAFEAAGSSTSAKTFQANRVYRSGIRIAGRNWLVGGPTDAESNLVIGLRAAIDAYGEGTVVRGNYVHVLMPRSELYPWWSQVSTFTTAKGALAEENVIRDGEWIVQFVEGEFRRNLVCDINDHNFLRNGSTGRIHHNLFVAGRPDHPPGSQGGCVFVVYPPKDGERGAEVFNNVFDAGGVLNVPGVEVNPDGFVKSLRNNVFFNFAGGEKFIRHEAAMVRATWTEPLADPLPVRLGYADYNCFWSPKAPSRKLYALGVAGKSPRKDAGFGLNDLPRGGGPDAQSDPKFAGPIPEAFLFDDVDIKAGNVTVSQILARYRAIYAPAPGSPLIDAGDPADGDGTDIGAVDAGRPAPR